MDAKALIAQAAALARPFTPSADLTTASIAAAILGAGGGAYTGVCVDTSCSLGFCAEHAAAAEMFNGRESHVKAAVAVDMNGEIMPPCGHAVRQRRQEMGIRIALGATAAVTRMIDELLRDVGYEGDPVDG